MANVCPHMPAYCIPAAPLRKTGAKPYLLFPLVPSNYQCWHVSPTS